MPSASKSQSRLMFAAASKPSMARKLGVPYKVAKEWSAADRKKGTKGLPESKK
jgi:hypothetical protein